MNEISNISAPLSQRKKVDIILNIFILGCDFFLPLCHPNISISISVFCTIVFFHLGNAISSYFNVRRHFCSQSCAPGALAPLIPVNIFNLPTPRRTPIFLYFSGRDSWLIFYTAPYFIQVGNFSILINAGIFF